MSIYAIGDIQGCYTAFCKLLDKLKFDPAVDRLWLVGDLVNRGGKSLEVLRQIHTIRDSVSCVLGNHDLHLLAAAEVKTGRHRNPEFTRIFRASDGDELLDWLRQQPLLRVDDERRLILVHAGLAPGWTVKKAQRLAAKVSERLAGKPKQRRRFYTAMYGDRPAVWQPGLNAEDELRVITNTLTRMRYCAPDGLMSLTDNGPPGTQKKGYQPWFTQLRRSSDYTIIFGHWSTLGLYFGHQAVCLDSGCVWGGKLTALRIGEKFDLIQVKGQTG